MNGHDDLVPRERQEEIVELGSTPPRVVLHRLAAVRREKGIHRRELAQRLSISVQELRLMEQSADLSIGTLSQWAAALGVPVTELVVEPDDCLPPTRLAESQATRLMKVAARLRDRSRRRAIQRLAQTFVEQLAEIVPALQQLGEKNHRRAGRVRGQPPAAPRPLPMHVFFRRPETR
jgi:transcriptional regulator with XRE-family HTH domain